MEETIGKASLRDAPIRTRIAVDKMLALTGQTPVLQIANIVLPTAENENEKERERRERHAKLDAIARKLMESREPSA
jgi:DNA-binding MurR/RpiR family transcriptional regulator